MVSIRHNPPAPATGTLARSAYNADHDVPVATQAEAQAGTATDKVMTPLRTAQAIGSIAPAAHVHTIANVTGLQAALDAKQNTLVSGTSIKTVNGESLLGSGNIVVSGGGGSTAWGGITGTLSAQTDLQTALNARQPLSTVLTNTTASFTTAQETKLAGIASGATANATDAQLRDRATHTGTQAIATVTGLQAALDGKVASDPTGITGADAITNIVSLTQAEYDAIPTKNATTFYVVTA